MAVGVRPVHHAKFDNIGRGSKEMRSEELLLGFDAREMWLDGETLWDENRRNDYLFRPDVAKPLSTDTIVWPSVFDTSLGPQSWVGYQDLYSDLESLQGALNVVRASRVKPCYVISITLTTEGLEKQEQEEWNAMMPPPTPAVRSSEWSLLGYDVSDRWLLSGLSNCGFLPAAENVQQLRDKWGSHLNKFHLFDGIERAREFKQFSDERVKEHAPFFVFGIWLIQETTFGA